MLQKISISDKCFSFELLKNLGKIVPQFLQNYSSAKHIITRNVSWTPNQHIRMISEGPCDTFYATYSNRNWITFIFKSIYNIIYIILFTILLKLYFWINKFSLGEQKRLQSKTFQFLPTPNFWTVVFLLYFVYILLLLFPVKVISVKFFPHLPFLSVTCNRQSVWAILWTCGLRLRLLTNRHRLNLWTAICGLHVHITEFWGEILSNVHKN